MCNDRQQYRRHRFRPEIISHAVSLYHRFGSGLRDGEDLLAERGITVSLEAIRLWYGKFGLDCARRLRRRRGRLGDTWSPDEVFVTIRGERHHLWRAVDQDGNVIDILVQCRRSTNAAKRFFRKLLKRYGSEPRWLITDKLRNYGAALRSVILRPRWSNSRRATGTTEQEVSHQRTRQRERQMRNFNSAAQAQRFLSVHGVALNLFSLGRHRLRSDKYRLLRGRAFAVWIEVTAA